MEVKLPDTEADVIETTPEPEEAAVVEVEVEAAPSWVKELRKSHREVQRENRELRKKLEGPKDDKPKVLRDKPRLAAHDYDDEAFEKDLETWYNEKREVEAVQLTAQQQKDEQAKAWQARLDTYATQKGELGYEDYADAEDEVLHTLSEIQQGILIQGSDNPAAVVYALGKSPKKAIDLASITDPVKFAFAVAKLEKGLDMNKTPKAAPPAPETRVKGSANSSGTVDSTLDKLREEADRTGDRSKVTNYLREKKRNS